MTLREAKTILIEYNKWRNGEPPYDGWETHPHTVQEITEAIDVGIESIEARLELSHCKK